MATSTISDTITDPSGVVVVGARVVARLLPTPGSRIDAGTEVVGQVETVTNASGVWSLALERNSNITPANTFYEITEYVEYGTPQRTHRVVWNVQVGSSNQTVQQAQVLAPPAQPDLYSPTTHAHSGTYERLHTFDVSAYGAVGNGTADDTAAIQAAITAAQAAGGGVVYFPAGTYKTTAVLQITASNITLQGAGQGFSIIRLAAASNSRVVAVNPGPGGSVTQLSDISVFDLTLDQQGASQTYATSDGTQVGAISAVYVKRFTMRSCTVLNGRDEGVNLRRCDYALVDGVVVDTVVNQNAANGINLQSNATPDNPYVGCRVVNCTVINSADLGINATSSGDGTVIANNTVEGGNTGIWTEGGNGGTGANIQRGRRTVISANTVRNTAVTGIAAADSSGSGNTTNSVEDVAITGNFVYGCPTGIAVNGTAIAVTGNIVDGSTTDGIIAGRTRDYTEGPVAITGNTVRPTTGRGIAAVKVSATNELRGVTIVGNTIEGTGSGGTYGIDIRGNVTAFVVSANMVRNSYNTGLRISNDTTSATSPQRGDVAGNTIVDPNAGTSASDTDGSGIGCSGATNVYVRDNVIIDTQSKMRYRMFFTGTITNCASFNNQGSNGTQGGLSGAPNTTISELVSLGNTVVNLASGTGGTVNVGTNTATTSNVAVNGAAGNARQLTFRTAGVDRWYVRGNTTAEGGSNAGTDLEVISRDDSGNNLGTALTVTRANRVVTAATGFVHATKAGAPVDGDFATAPPNGTMVIDTTNSRLYVRIGGTWKAVQVS